MKQNRANWTFTFLLVGIILIISGSCSKDEAIVTPEDKYNFIVPTKQEAFVLLKTATWCHYCWEWGNPAMADAFAGKNSVDSTRVNGFELHSSKSDPMYNVISDSLQSYFGIDGTPNLWVEFSNDYNLNPTGWASSLKSKQNETNPICGLALKKERIGGVINIYVKVKFFATQTGKYNLAVYVTENGIVSPQTSSTGTVDDYVHNHVLRGEISKNEPLGIQMFNGMSIAEYRYKFVFTPGSELNINNLHFVGVIYKMDGSMAVESTNSNSL